MGMDTISAFFQQSGSIRRLSIDVIRIDRKKIMFKRRYISTLAQMQSRPRDLFFLRFLI